MKVIPVINLKNIVAFFLLYFSLLSGFFLGEDLNFGATEDWLRTDLPVIKDLTISIKNTLLNYESYGHRHSPVYLIFLSIFKKIGFSFDAIRFLHLNISLLLIYFFYKCLAFKFKDIDKNLLIFFCLVIFLSPTFRSLAIWPSTRIAGLIFFVLSIYEFLKFQERNLNIHLWKNIIFLIISSYISPNFSLFIIYFFYHFLKKTDLKTLFLILVFCFLCSLPAIYYIFVLDINFLTAGTPGANSTEAIGFSFNFSNKILIISSIIFFQLIPFLINKKFLKEFLNSFKSIIFYVLVVFLINLIFFNYLMNFTGGGIFFQISNYLIGNNLIFYFFSFLSIMLIAYFVKNNVNNFLIISILIISNIQNTIYHKYYDPLVMIIFFTIYSSFLSLEFFKKNVNFIYLYCFYISFIIMRLVKNYIVSGF